MIVYLTEQQKQDINQRIRDIELQTQAELVTVIAHNSDDYRYIPTLWAAVLSLSFPGLLALLTIELNYVYPLQVLIFILLAIVFQYSPIKMRLVPKYIKQSRASRHAHELFFIEGLHLTQNNTGIMLFVSVDEKYAEIIADQGINAKVTPEAWQTIIDAFINSVKQKQLAEAYLGAIDACGELLITHYPATNKQANELPDHLIEV